MTVADAESAQHPMPVDTAAKAVVRAHVEAFNRGDLDALRALLADDAEMQGVLGTGTFERIAPVRRQLIDGYGMQLQIESLVAERNVVAARYVETGTFRALALALVLAVAPWSFSVQDAKAGQPPMSAASAQEGPTASAGATGVSVLTREQQETFLRTARIVRARRAPGGVTGSLRVTLTDGVLTHDAHVQTVDREKREFRGRKGNELNFRDSWKFNVAAYQLSVLLGLDMVPVSVERPYQRTSAAFTWWIDDVMMDEATRLQTHTRVPNPHAWNRRLAIVRVFDQLIYNTDRNLGNLVITEAWDLWMIDHTRAFRRHRAPSNIESLYACDRALLARIEALDRPTLHRVLSRWLLAAEIEGLLARRDAIVQHFRNGPQDRLFDLPPRGAAGRLTPAEPSSSLAAESARHQR